MQAIDTGKAVYWGTGRRKSAIARVRLVPGSGQVIINGREGELYLQFNSSYLSATKAPLETLGLENDYDVLVNVQGGGLTGQAESIRLGVARALCELSPDNRQPLKAEGYLTRDPRAKERKKYGLRKARKAPQYSKR
ncbi:MULTISPECIES: 30S ribosomal protein S9 [Arthrospira]|jgi:small subunit ribosomal protein S9|uniref:Small ribosomal subunit protein uS9 n=1 Tax=Limnospira platensis NIES-46 TaxID=1236695 RepID=A0A5M3SZF6_LIMPL|nr:MULTISPECIES: 30S ribosomal protein S9 [Arthrospira]AMW28221.1 30S ribosomal protein S9 [Arthrospira platensis YZ]KDR56843.1 30S ribosomal protein S9 [Arthrospira platensis str. Paraca]MBD2668426.1 30S ribosomal protein S9 [Arthrospira platensis FACHB-439]MBD2711425.1 30S ribosomal protein S9 [Arthrospira platensis FACHB-835]MDF2209366.1 30S ribosomal protein S9 [Arthrospira platensis NCB002]MDT9182030.1 30S ribosomal protein S9 [Limnospira sp. PMC 289.06]MDT9294091.1 30S ribosomal protei